MDKDKPVDFEFIESRMHLIIDQHFYVSLVLRPRTQHCACDIVTIRA